MERYSEYKDSGVQWLGEIPGHWKCVRLKHTGSCRNGLTYSPTDECEYGNGTLVLRSSNIQDDKLSFEDNVYVKKDIDEDLMMRSGDILICSRNGSRDLVGKLVRINKDLDMTFGAFMMVYRTNLWAPFMEYALRIVIASYKNLFSTSTINQLVKSKFENFVTPLPPLSEQHSIVSYLDDKCGKIDKMLEGKQKQIELLAEMKQRIIADAVTRGLNPDVKMKATNIPWLPEIPEHWDVKRGKTLFNKEQRPIEEGDEIVTCFRDGEVTLRKNRRTTGFTEATDYSHYQHICKGDLVIHQMDAFAGSSGVSDSDGMGTPVLSVCTAKIEGLNHFYYAYILRLMGKNNFILSLYRGIRERSSDFRFETFAKQYLPVPPAIEQEQIVKFIHERSSKIDTLTSKLQQEIESIKEYKQRLISDVVTGQIKVC
jgi:type I restriction enzyme S subunit